MSEEDQLQAQTHRETMEVLRQHHQERLEKWINFTGNALALLMALGFFGTIGSALLGFVDISNSTEAALLGTILGYIVASMGPVSGFYFKSFPKTPEKDDKK